MSWTRLGRFLSERAPGDALGGLTGKIGAGIVCGALGLDPGGTVKSAGERLATDPRFDAVNARFDASQVENSRQHDALNRRFDELFEVLRTFEGRISRLEGRLDPQGDEGSALDGP